MLYYFNLAIVFFNILLAPTQTGIFKLSDVLVSTAAVCLCPIYLRLTFLEFDWKIQTGKKFLGVAK